MIDLLARPGTRISGSITVPGDKSISHRALLFASICDGSVSIRGFLHGEDTLATAALLRSLGVDIESSGRYLRVYGVGMHGLQAPDSALDCGNAGTAMRLAAGLLSAQRFSSSLTGDASLSRRPMQRVIEPLQQMGADIRGRDGGFPPLHMNPTERLQGIEYRPRVASAQIKSALLLAGLYARGSTMVIEPQRSRDHSERMLAAFGVDIERDDEAVAVVGGQALRAIDVDVPGDFSSAAFFIVAACLVPGSDIELQGVGLNPGRIGLLTALREMGAAIDVTDSRVLGFEPVGDLRIRAAPLRGIDLDPSLVPDLIDELPVLMVAAAFAEGRTRIRGAAELRVKESDRLAVMSTALRALGVEVLELPDGADIEGCPPDGSSLGPSVESAPLEIDSAGDHRVAMAVAVAAQCTGQAVRIIDCANIATSFPGFTALAKSVGFGVRELPRGSAATVEGPD